MTTEESNCIPLGQAPAILAKRNIVKPNDWCPVSLFDTMTIAYSKPIIDFDKCCDPDNPKTIYYKDVCRAREAIRLEVPKTPLVRSKCCVQLGLELNYKFEILHRTGSFHERTAQYCLHKLKKSQRDTGVYTASLGNWGMALAYSAQKFDTPLTVVLPEGTAPDIVEKCQKFGANVVLHGKNLEEAKRQAFVLMAEKGSETFINGYDHPNVIAASGSIGIEILEDLPQTDAILVPVGGGALLAGIATAVKHLKPSILVYGVEPHKCCCFFKAMENERPYRTEPVESLADLGVPTAGHNSFHTAKSLIDKMVLVDDDWIAKAIMHLSEEEKYVVEGAGAAPLSAILTLPDLLPELKDKTVVCVVTGGNIDLVILCRAIERAKALEGRLIKITVTMKPDDTKLLNRILSIIANVGCSLRDFYKRNVGWFEENEVATGLITLVCETKHLKHACTLKRVLKHLFPNICEFLEEPYSPIPKCLCYPIRKY